MVGISTERLIKGFFIDYSRIYKDVRQSQNDIELSVQNTSRHAQLADHYLQNVNDFVICTAPYPIAA